MLFSPTRGGAVGAVEGEALRDSGVDFVCADMPEANTLTIGIFSLLAQHERELISQPTRAALQAKKEQAFDRIIYI